MVMVVGYVATDQAPHWRGEVIYTGRLTPEQAALEVDLTPSVCRPTVPTT